MGWEFIGWGGDDGDDHECPLYALPGRPGFVGRADADDMARWMNERRGGDWLLDHDPDTLKPWRVYHNACGLCPDDVTDWYETIVEALEAGVRALVESNEDHQQPTDKEITP